MRERLIQRLKTAVEADEKVLIFRLEPVHEAVIERRDFAVFPRRQALQPGLAGMHPDGIRAGALDAGDKRAKRHLGILIIDADAALDGDRDRHGLLHRRHAFGDQRRLLHQAGPKGAGLHPVRGAADIHVDLVIAESFGDPRRLRHLRRIVAAKLQRDRMLRGVMAEQPVPIAPQDCIGDDHFRIEQRMARELPREEAIVPIGPVDHRRHGEHGPLEVSPLLKRSDRLRRLSHGLIKSLPSS